METVTVTVHEARSRLSQLVDRAAAGEDVLVSRHGLPVARITGLAGTDAPRQPIRFGLLQGRIAIADDFDAPLPADLQTSFDGR